MKTKIFISTIVLAITLSLKAHELAPSQCPELDGRYDRCYSELKQMRGEYIIDQQDQNGVEVFKVQFVDDETDESRADVIYVDGRVEKRKERVPVIGIKVNVESKSSCKNNRVVTEANAYAVFNRHVGQFTTTLERNKNQLIMLINGKYIGRSINKIIKCQLIGTPIEN